MAGFDADTAVEKLDWKFSTGDSGVVPEPSTDQVGEFFDQLHTILDRPKDESDKKVIDYFAAMSSNQRMFADEKILAAYAALCGDCPTTSQLAALPHRERQAFFGWITGQVLDPT